MHPSIFFRGEKQTISSYPLPEVLALDSGKGIAVCVAGTPNLFGLSALRVGHHDGPWLQTFAIVGKRVINIEQSDESDAFSVGRPAGSGVAIDRGRKKPKALGVCVIDHDKTMIAAG